METEDMLDWMLAEAKKKPMEIHHDFDTRFRVWVEQIIPSRIDAIRQSGGDRDYVMRMVRLTTDDAVRLTRRAYDEAVPHVDRIGNILVSLIAANDAYLNEVKQ